MASLIAVFIVSLISLIGIFFVGLNQKTIQKVLLFLVSFSAGALLGDTFIHLLPEITETKGFGLEVSLYLLAGLLTFFIIEKFIAWRHCHLPTTKTHPHKLGFMNLIGDGFHNFIDGMLITGSFIVSWPLGISTTLAVIFHEIPQEIGDYGVLLYAGFSRPKALFFNFLTALTAILGAIFILILGKSMINISDYIVPFTAGGFIYIAGSDLIPELHKETIPARSLLQFFGLLLGIGIMLLLPS